MQKESVCDVAGAHFMALASTVTDTERGTAMYTGRSTRTSQAAEQSRQDEADVIARACTGGRPHSASQCQSGRPDDTPTTPDASGYRRPEQRPSTQTSSGGRNLNPRQLFEARDLISVYLTEYVISTPVLLYKAPC